MAENIEELKQTIDSVITSNGNGQITGQGLNILLNEMTDLLSTMGGNSGNNPYCIYMGDPATGELTPEEQEHNAEIFSEMYPKLQTGEFVDAYVNMHFDDTSVYQISQIALAATTVENVRTIAIAFMAMMDVSSVLMLLLNEDGSVQQMQ